MRPTVSLTFDDGLWCQSDFALPYLDARDVKGTFFIPSKAAEFPIVNPGVWKRAAANGHEIGSHSVTHAKAATLNPTLARFETSGSQMQLKETLGVGTESYCYPYTDAPGFIQDQVKQFYSQARGGRGARHDKYMVPGEGGVNLYNVPSLHVGPYTCENAELWAKEAVARKAWVVLMFHGVGDPQAWDNISIEQFKMVVDTFQECGVDIATFAQGAARYRSIIS